jgi:hypothetical protein
MLGGSSPLATPMSRALCRFFIHYAENMNLKLIKHTDDSMLTINICLYSKCVGTDLRFFGKQTLLTHTENHTHGGGSTLCKTGDLPPGDQIRKSVSSAALAKCNA